MKTRKIHRPFTIFEDPVKDHGVIWLGLDEAEAEKGILTNQYMIVDSGEAALLDPGGYFVFERIYRNVTEYVEPEEVTAIFYSHQDPDVVGSLNILLDMFPNAKIYVSSLWIRFLPHLGILDSSRMNEIPDNGGKLRVGSTELYIIPAHFLHSPGNFHLYDPVSKSLFTGDLGAAIFREGEWYLFVEDFEKHVAKIIGFHKRYIPCRKAVDLWLKRIKDLEINYILPQHGAIFEGKNAKKFIEWLKTLDKVGLDLMQTS